MNRRVSIILSLFVAAAFVSCAGPSRDDIKKVKIVEKKDLVKCQAIDTVRGENAQGSEALAIEAVKKAALELDSDSIFIQDSVNNGGSYVVTAMAYHCKK